jgi:AcrR family transcriptional regulator
MRIRAFAHIVKPGIQMASKKSATLRRQPQQARGERRIAELLDAADRVFAAVGYEAATTNAIAREAGASVGSLYQFFPDKEALLLALAGRYRSALYEIHERVFTEETARLPLDQLYDRVVETLAAFYRAHPGFRPLLNGSQTVPALATAAATLHQECVDRVDAMMRCGLPDMAPGRRRMLADLNVTALKALLPLAESGNARFRAEILLEIKRMLHAHMRAVMSEIRGDANAGNRAEIRGR